MGLSFLSIVHLIPSIAFGKIHGALENLGGCGTCCQVATRKFPKTKDIFFLSKLSRAIVCPIWPCRMFGQTPFPSADSKITPQLPLFPAIQGSSPTHTDHFEWAESLSIHVGKRQINHKWTAFSFRQHNTGDKPLPFYKATVELASFLHQFQRLAPSFSADGSFKAKRKFLPS